MKISPDELAKLCAKAEASSDPGECVMALLGGVWFMVHVEPSEMHGVDTFSLTEYVNAAGDQWEFYSVPAIAAISEVKLFSEIPPEGDERFEAANVAYYGS